MTSGDHSQKMEESGHRSEYDEALRCQKDQFTTLVENIPDIVARLDRDLRFLYISPAVLAVTGIPPEEYIGKPRKNTGIAPEFVKARDELSRKVFETGRVQILELPIQTPSGERYFESRLIPEFAPDGSVASLMTLTRDITDRKHAEESRRAADRRKDEFLAILAHELRNPLAPIRNSLHILRLASQHDPTAKRVSEILERQVDHMVRLVDDLLEVSRITRGKIVLRRERVELETVARGALEISRPFVEAGGHELTFQVAAGPLVVDGDPVRLTQVIANLLNNAAKYTDTGGHIWLNVARDGEWGTITVRDTGAGIPPEMLDRVFDLFTQIDRSGDRAQGGLGIGLTIVQSLVEMHGGRVTARSDGPGQGSEFAVRLPLVATDFPGGLPTKKTSNARLSVTHRVLVVDDNRDSAESLGMLLELIGADVRIAYDGPAALDALATYQPTVVLLDIGMPGMDGHEVARRIRRQPEFQNVPLIALTGWGQEQDRHRSHVAGFDHHLIKPADVDTLQSLLSSFAGNTPGSTRPTSRRSSD